MSKSKDADRITRVGINNYLLSCEILASMILKFIKNKGQHRNVQFFLFEMCDLEHLSHTPPNDSL